MRQAILKNILVLNILFSVWANAQYTVFVHADSRFEAMGGAGYALADDESALFYNPAGLGVNNPRWSGGASNYAEAGMFLRTLSAYYQVNRNHTLGFASYLNHINYTPGGGVYADIEYNDDGLISNIAIEEDRIYEFTCAVGAGYNIFTSQNVSRSIGIAMKYIRFQSEHFNSPDYHEAFFNFDIGYLTQLKNHIRLGVVLQNLRIATPTWNYQGDIPITLAAGAGLKYGFNFKQIHFLDISSELSIVNDFYFGSASSNSSRFNTGIETVLFRTVAGRFGLQIDKNAIEPFNLTFGFGISLFNHFEINYYLNQRNTIHYDFNRMGASVNFIRMLKWEKADLRWFKEYQQ